MGQRTGTCTVGDRLRSNELLLISLHQQGVTLLRGKPLKLKLGNAARRIVEAQRYKRIIVRGQMTIARHPCPHDKHKNDGSSASHALPPFIT